MTTESVTAKAPYVIDKVIRREAELFENLKAEHFAAHPDHETVQYPDVCAACAAIVGYRDTAVRLPLTGPVVTCSECGLPLGNEDLLAEHQATAHRFSDKTEADIATTHVSDVPLEDVL